MRPKFGPFSLGSWGYAIVVLFENASTLRVIVNYGTWGIY